MAPRLLLACVVLLLCGAAQAVIDWLGGRQGKPVYQAAGRPGLTTSLRPDQAALDMAFRR